MTLTEAAVADGAISAGDAAEIEALWTAIEQRVPIDARPRLSMQRLDAFMAFLEYVQSHWSSRCHWRMQ